MGQIPKGVIEGQVRGMAIRRDRTRESQSDEVWSFRVERFDAAGNRVLFVPVEMRGFSFQGALADGDLVRFTGKVKKGTVVARKVTNVTTGAQVTAARHKGCLAAVIIVACLLLVISGIYLAIALHYHSAWPYFFPKIKFPPLHSPG